MRHVIIGAGAAGITAAEVLRKLDTEHVGALRGLIQGRIELGAWRERLLTDPSLFMPAYLASAEKLA